MQLGIIEMSRNIQLAMNMTSVPGCSDRGWERPDPDGFICLLWLHARVEAPGSKLDEQEIPGSPLL